MMRFNHMELTFPIGSLTAEARQQVDDFYGEVFGWSGLDTMVVDQSCHLLQLDEYANSFILLAEHKTPMSREGFHHLGLLQETREEVDELLEKCRKYQSRDDRVEVKEYKDLVTPGHTLTVHAFYVRYLLPLWFDVQCMERPAGVSLPGWSYN
jgi:hypothetical protein